MRTSTPPIPRWALQWALSIVLVSLFFWFHALRCVPHRELNAPNALNRFASHARTSENTVVLEKSRMWEKRALTAEKELYEARAQLDMLSRRHEEAPPSPLPKKIEPIMIASAPSDTKATFLGSATNREEIVGKSTAEKEVDMPAKANPAAEQSKQALDALFLGIEEHKTISTAATPAIASVAGRRWREESELPIPSAADQTSNDLSFEMQASHGLSFIHIAKTGGTSIELAGFEKGIQWGEKRKSHRKGGKIKFSKAVRCNWWHVPPRFIASDLGQYYPKIKQPARGLRSFCVVRNPITRLLSAVEHWYWSLNITQRVERMRTLFVSDFVKNPYFSDCHYAKQRLYVLDDSGERTCNYVLRYETLRSDMDRLMRQFNLNLSLGWSLKKDARLRERAIDWEQDVPPSLHAMVMEYYREDFELFYPDDKYFKHLPAASKSKQPQHVFVNQTKHMSRS